MDAATREAMIVAAFNSATSTLAGDFDAVDLLHTLIAECTNILELEAGGILLVAGASELSFVTSTSAAAERVASVTLEHRSGPCIECYLTGEPIVMSDVSHHASRWPDYCMAALDEGFGSVLVIPMRMRGMVVGAMDLFGAQPRNFDSADVKLAQTLAAVASLAILQERMASEAQVVEAQLRQALESRIAIEQAKGVLASAQGVDMDEAFRLLRSFARSNNLRIQLVAEHVVDGTVSPLTIANQVHALAN